MRTSKRIVAIILTLCMLIPASMSAFAADFTDVSKDDSYYEAVDVLNGLGIIKGYPDGTFLPDNDVTRAEFTTMLMRAMDMESAAATSYNPNTFPFTDCGDSSIEYALGNISMAYEKGIILGMGDGIFAPKDNVTYEQAVKMIVCAAGYGYAVETEDGGYPHGYIKRAEYLDILHDVNGEVGVAAKRWQIAQLIYNTFNINLMEKITEGSYMVNDNKTWMSEYLNLYEDSGMVTSDAITSISATNQQASKGECIILSDKVNKEILFTLGDCSVEGLVGKQVHYFYKYNTTTREYTLVYLADDSAENSSITVDVADLIDFDDLDPINGGVVSYWQDADSDNARQARITVDASPIFVLNGKAYSPSSASQFKTDMTDLINGSVEFVYDTKSNIVTKIFITKIDTYVVNTVTTDSRSGVTKIIDLYRNSSSAQKNTFEIDTSDGTKVITVTDKNGKAIEPSAITKYMVLDITESQTSTGGRDLLEIKAIANSISGTVSEISYLDGNTIDTVTISGTTYDVSTYFNQYAIGNDPSNAITLNTTATFYLDSKGRIAAMNKTADSYYYGYVYRISTNDETSIDSSQYSIRLVDSNGSTKVYTITKNIKYDGTTLDPSAGYSYLLSTARMTNYDESPNPASYSQLIKYTLDSSSNISSITTVNNPGEQPDNLTRIAYNYSTDAEDGSYEKETYNYATSSSGNFQSGNTKVSVNSSTIVFVADSARSAESVRKSTVAKELKSKSKYLFEAFDEKSSVAKVIVLYKQDNEDEKISASTPLTILQKISASQAENNEGETGMKFNGFNVSTSFSEKTDITTATTSWTSEPDDNGDTTEVNVALGDVLKTVTNKYEDVSAVEKIWSPSNPTDVSSSYINTPHVSDNSTYYRTIVGYLYELEDESITVVPGVDLANIDVDTRESFTLNPTSTNCGYLMYDASKPNDPVYQIKFEELALATSYVDAPTEASIVFIQLTGSNANNLTPKLIYIVK